MGDGGEMTPFASGEYRGFLVTTDRIYGNGARHRYLTVARRGNLEIESMAVGKQARERCRKTVIEEIDRLLESEVTQ